MGAVTEGIEKCAPRDVRVAWR